MPPPVRIKVYGLISLTRRGYLVCLGLGAVLFVVLLALWALLIAPRSPAEPAEPGEPALWALLRDGMPWVIVAAALLEGVEAYFVLRRFRRAEAEQRAGAQETPKGS
jgi:hypothetical protein